jgi:hypothetical protein
MVENYCFSPPSTSLLQEWEAEWRTEATALCTLLAYVAYKAAEWGYQECQAQYTLAAMDIVPPIFLEEDEDDD